MITLANHRARLSGNSPAQHEFDEGYLMPTIMTHAIVPLAIAVTAGPRRISPRVALVGALLAMVPDADVIGFKFGVDYGAAWGHRGATHSIAIAVLVAGLLAVVWKPARSGVGFFFLAFAMASHGLLDMATDGGLGVAIAWPVSVAREFWPFTPIRVSPIGANFFSARGMETLYSEFRWGWVPCIAIALAAVTTRFVIRQPRHSAP